MIVHVKLDDLAGLIRDSVRQTLHAEGVELALKQLLSGPPYVELRGVEAEHIERVLTRIARNVAQVIVGADSNPENR